MFFSTYVLNKKSKCKSAESKSPLELTIYFLLLTIGITLTSSPIKAIFLCFLSCLIIFIYSIYLGFKNRGKLNLNTTLNIPFEGNSYLIDKTEVTQREYRRVMGENSNDFSGCMECPVENISWHDESAI